MARTKTIAKKKGKGSKKLGKKKTGRKTAPAKGGIISTKARRWRPGTVALRDIRRYQKSTKTLMQRLPFQRLVRELAREQNAELRFQASALLAL